MTNTGKSDFIRDLRDAVTPRAFTLVLGVLLLQFGFIASYLGAFHNPKPQDIPISVVAPAGAPAGTAAQVAARLNALPGHPVQAGTAPDAAAARTKINDRSVYGAVLLGPDQRDELLVATAAGASVSTALASVVAAVDSAQHRTVTVTDVVPGRAR